MFYRKICKYALYERAEPFCSAVRKPVSLVVNTNSSVKIFEEKLPKEQNRNLAALKVEARCGVFGRQILDEQMTSQKYIGITHCTPHCTQHPAGGCHMIM